MAPHCTYLLPMGPSSRSLTVHTADGCPLFVVGTLMSNSFHVHVVLFIPNLTMQLMFAGQITDYDCHVTLDLDCCYVQDRCTGRLVGIGSHRRDSQRLWELDSLCLSSIASTNLVGSALAPSTPSFAQWHHRSSFGSYLWLLVIHF
jgi:hypothetical protein